MSTPAASARPLLLASASPRRREILATLGLSFDVTAIDADEAHRPDEAPLAYLERVVDHKLALAEPIAASRGNRAVLVADTTVVLDGRILAKPASPADNRAMFASLAGRTHHVHTRFALAHGSERHLETVTSEVSMRPLSDAEIDGYVASGEGLDKAGGYAIQGLGSFAIRQLRGSYTAVVGLPACEVVAALLRLGVIARFPV